MLVADVSSIAGRVGKESGKGSGKGSSKRPRGTSSEGGRTAGKKARPSGEHPPKIGPSVSVPAEGAMGQPTVAGESPQPQGAPAVPEEAGGQPEEESLERVEIPLPVVVEIVDSPEDVPEAVAGPDGEAPLVLTGEIERAMAIVETLCEPIAAKPLSEVPGEEKAEDEIEPAGVEVREDSPAKESQREETSEGDEEVGVSKMMPGLVEPSEGSQAKILVTEAGRGTAPQSEIVGADFLGASSSGGHPTGGQTAEEMFAELINSVLHPESADSDLIDVAFGRHGVSDIHLLPAINDADLMKLARDYTSRVSNPLQSSVNSGVLFSLYFLTSVLFCRMPY